MHLDQLLWRTPCLVPDLILFESRAGSMDSSEGCTYNYVVSAHTPTAVNKAVVGNFTGAGDINLIIS